ncbi:CDF family Co(II)/Ni(II) efflux transporter DmeF [Phenylobacterium immobile]|uniref:CDF family Co(II)/Ni(II) efflux transporter DmeF n=1 Tax=Phenylobacterium immobile TaxID=21 RepID=UPI000B28A890|nr:CDF family Co(II)/Ni(II) efflux transporter DmeF [Phenylobacterium immobile]
MTHDHVYLSPQHDENTRRTLWVVALTAAMMAGEIVAGIAFNSMSLLADGFHMATHAGALALAAAAYAYAKRHARSGRYSFGAGKVGDLAGFSSALILGLVAIGIGVESVQRLVDPRPVAFGEATIIAIVGLLVNLVSALLLGGGHSHSHGHGGHGHDHGHAHHDHDDHHHDHGRAPKAHDNNMRAAYVHVLADALTSVLAIAALLGGRFLGWVWLDPLMGLVGAAVILSWAWTLIRDTSAVLLDACDAKLEAEIRQEVEGPGDALITDLHVWRVGPTAHAAIVSVTGASHAVVRHRVATVHEIVHLTVETA